jgi:hypothetical protein
MKHCMIDLETYGTRPGCIVRSIAAVEFELSGQKGDTFYANVDEVSSRTAGLWADERTVAWWAKQSEAARGAFLDPPPRPLREVGMALAHWWSEHNCEFVWGQGAGFDAPIWEEALRLVGMVPVWKFFNSRDTRTVYHLCDFDHRSIERTTTAHHGMDDAKFQVDCVAAALKKANWRE